MVESIKIYNGRMYNIALHEARANQARAALWGITQKLDLRKHIIIPDTCKTGLVKCRVSYDTSIREITFVPYSVRQIKTLNHRNRRRPTLWLQMGRSTAIGSTLWLTR
ncbi:MAG: hypothetical protein IPJ39_07550 [Saprospiraceae bacterium]|nr:hypothetical protein [Saprospiraceae bacterium]